MAGVSASVLLCGSLITNPTTTSLALLRSTLVNDASFAELKRELTELPDVWSLLLDQEPSFHDLDAAPLFRFLSDWFSCDSSSPEKLQLPSGAPQNIYYAVLTVLIQISEYVTFLHGNASANEDHLHSKRLEDFRDGGIQGLCIGLLSAIALSCSHTKAELAQNVAVAVRLAVCAAASVDLAELHASEPTVCLSARWGRQEDRETDDGTIASMIATHGSSYISVRSDICSATITSQKGTVASLTASLEAQGASVKRINLCGRYHHAMHEPMFQKLLAMCDSLPLFQFPRDARPLVPLRRSDTGELVALEGTSLHEIALCCILIEGANWHATMFNSLEAMAAKATSNLQQLVLGPMDCTPRPALSSLPVRITRPAAVPESSYAYPDNAIAVVGLSCQFPNAHGPSKFWEMLENRQTATMLGPVDNFDCSLFRKSPREAEFMDPQQRMGLHLAYEALESGGYFRPAATATDKVGCYVGVSSCDYEDNVNSHDPTAFSFTGTARAFTSGRISHFFGFTGPSMAIDTACSSSGVAIHMACSAIQAGECEMALAGGLNLTTEEARSHQNLGAASFLSPTGECRPFDAAANGYRRGEGGGFVLLKRLSAAVAAGDHILGVVAASAVNNSKGNRSITLPSSESQSDLYEHVLRRAGLPPTQISYVEAHGTGTTKGDPIECRSIQKVLGKAQRPNTAPLLFGSVKGNFGHTEAASGVAAFIKTVLMLQRGQIPPQANFSVLNPAIPTVQDGHMEIPTQMRPWDAPFRAALVNNYGASGTNAAFVLCQPAPGTPVRQPARAELARPPKYPIFVSAQSPASLRLYCDALTRLVDSRRHDLGESVVPAVACRLAQAQNHELAHRRVFSAASVEELRAGLCSEAAMSRRPQASRPVVLVFGGQTGREVRLSEEVYQGSALLRRRLDACDRAMQSLGLAEGLFPRIFSPEPIEDLVALHCLQFAVQYAVAMAWIDAGLHVSALIGHSLGQLTSLAVSGVLSLRDALRLVSGRAALIKANWGPESGCMLSVDADASTVDAMVQALAGPEKPEIACYNSAVHHILAGTEASIAAIEGVGQAQGVRTQRLEVTHAFHSHLADAILPDYLKLVEELTLREAKIPIEACSSSPVCWSRATPRMIANQSRETVYFSDAVSRVEERLGPCIWLEAGSRSVGTALARRALKTNPATADSTSSFYSARPYGPEALEQVTRATLDLWMEGVPVQSWFFHGAQSQSYPAVELPSYCFDNSRLWLPLLEHAKDAEALGVAVSKPLPFVSHLETVQNGSEQIVKFLINQEHEEYALFAKGRTVFGQTLAPASVWMEAALRAFDLVLGQPSGSAPAAIHQLRMHRPFGLDHQRVLHLVLRKSAASGDSMWDFSVDSLTIKEGCDSNTEQHATGTVGRHMQQNSETRAYLSLFRHLSDRCVSLRQDLDASQVNGTFIAKILAPVADYDKTYMGIRSIISKGYEGVGLVDMPAIAAEKCAATALIPPLFDNILIAGEIHAGSLEGLDRDSLYICKSIESVIPHVGLQGATSKEQGPWTVHSRLEREGDREMICDLIVFKPGQKTPALSILGAQFTQVPTRSLRQALLLVNQSEAVAVPALPMVSETPKSKLAVYLSPASGTQALSPSKELSSDDWPQRGICSRTYSASNLIADDCSDASGLSSSTSLSSAAEPEQPVHSENAKVLMNLLSDHISITGGIPSDTPLVMLGLDSLVMMQLKSDMKKAFGSQVNVSKADENLTFSGLYSALFPGESSTQELSHSASRKAPAEFKSPAPRPEATIPTRLAKNPGTRSAFVDLTTREFASLKEATSLVIQETGFTGFFTNVYPDQTRLVNAYIVEAFATLGCDLRKTQAGELLPPVSYQSKYNRLMARIYTILEASGLVEACDDQRLQFRKGRQVVEETPSTHIYSDILSQHPHFRPEHELLGVTGPHLAACLTGEAEGLQLIFQEAESRKLLEDVYVRSPMFATGNALLGRFVTQLLQAQAAAADKDDGGELHILEIGAGTGGTTGRMLDLLLAHKAAFRYVFTDISAALVTSTRRRFEARYGRAVLERHVEFTVLDIERAPPAERAGRYDFVLSSNCIHATRNLHETCANIERLLRPDGGMLCLLELARPLPWLDCVFGLLGGWWRFEDGREYALAHEHHWRDVLTGAGFARVDWSDDGTPEAQQFRLITAWR